MLLRAPLRGLCELQSSRARGLLRLRRAAGGNPFAYRFDRTASAAALQAGNEALAAGEEKGGSEAVAGRIMARRIFGKLAFLSLQVFFRLIVVFFCSFLFPRGSDLCFAASASWRGGPISAAACLRRLRAPGPRGRPQDESGTIQLYCDLARMGDAAFEAVKSSLDIGDIVGAHGPVKRTEKGELSIVVTQLTMLTKSLLPLPDKFHGLTNVEQRYRQRYVDMLSRPEARHRETDASGSARCARGCGALAGRLQVRETFRMRSKIISSIRRHLEDKGFLEIETPVLQVRGQGFRDRGSILEAAPAHSSLHAACSGSASGGCGQGPYPAQD